MIGSLIEKGNNLRRDSNAVFNGDFQILVSAKMYKMKGSRIRSEPMQVVRLRSYYIIYVHYLVSILLGNMVTAPQPV